jgi:SPP1 family predicted phage head-tail adaptor
MQAGRLRHWLTFQTPGEEEPDSDGAMSFEWLDAFEVSTRMPCSVEALSGRELIAAQAVQSEVTTRIRTRYRPGFHSVQRAIGTDGTIYNIRSVVPDEDSRRRYVTLLATSGTDAGGTAA